MTEGKDGFVNRREYSRVYAYIPLKWRVVPPEEHHMVRCRMSGEVVCGQSFTYPDIEDPMLGEWLRIINDKLDTIIKIMTVQAEGFYSLPYRAVNISGSGISFSVSEDVQVGDLIEIKTVLCSPIFHHLYLHLYGEVLKAERQTSGCVIAARFVKMDDMIRDEIVRFVFDREREILREKKKQEGLD